MKTLTLWVGPVLAKQNDDTLTVMQMRVMIKKNILTLIQNASLVMKHPLMGPPKHSSQARAQAPGLIDTRTPRPPPRPPYILPFSSATHRSNRSRAVSVLLQERASKRLAQSENIINSPKHDSCVRERLRSGSSCSYGTTQPGVRGARQQLLRDAWAGYRVSLFLEGEPCV